MVRRGTLIAVCVLISLAIAGGIWGAVQFQTPNRSVIRLDISRPRPPLPVPLKEGFLPIGPDKAQLVNSDIPLSSAPLEAARPFLFKAAVADLVSRNSAVDCLTAAIYYEAAGESNQGQRAVAQVVLNRVRHPAFPKSVCGVVYEGAELTTGCQFSFTCDGSLARKPSQFGWLHARQIAQAALAGAVERSVGTATHYHANYVVPYWAWSLDKITTIGTHIFYRWKGYWGRRSAFTGVYSGETEQGEAEALFAGMPLNVPTHDLQGSPVPSGPRPVADDIGRLGERPQSVIARSTAPKADRERGTLVADEKAGRLVASSPKGQLTQGSAPQPRPSR
jgi:hypothetical protein